MHACETLVIIRTIFEICKQRGQEGGYGNATTVQEVVTWPCV